MFCCVSHSADIPGFSDPHIPLVAREIMQRMIRQFAAEYTSKTSSSQDSLQPNGTTKDQSLPKAPSLALALAPAPGTTPPATAITTGVTAAAASAQNPVLSKLLMADQDSPLDLTVKKADIEPSDQGSPAHRIFPAHVHLLTTPEPWNSINTEPL